MDQKLLLTSQGIQVEGRNYKLVGKGNKEFFNGFIEKKRTKTKS
jgi:hypothetical protein